MKDLRNEIHKYTFASMDKMRGFKTAEESQRFILESIFAKMIIDASKEKSNFIIELLNVNNEFDSLELSNIKDNQGVKVFISALTKLVQDNNKYLSGVFKDIYLLQDKNLANLGDSILRDLNNVDFQPYINNCSEIGELFDEFFEHCLNQTMSPNLTSKSIKRLFSDLLEKDNFKTVYDPAIGIGGLVTGVASKHKDTVIYGQEIDEDTLSICKMMLIATGKGESINNITLGDVLIEPGNADGKELKKYDCIVSAPPFGLSVSGYQHLENDRYDRFHRGLPPKSAADYAFLSHIVESLKDDGVAVVQVSNGILFRGGNEGKIREQFINENIIDCIIGLPGNMLYNTAIATSLIIMRKNRKRKNILFNDVKKEEKISRTITVLSSDEIKRIVNSYSDYKSIEGFSTVVSQEQIIENDYNLNVSRYISNYEKEELDLETINNNIGQLEKKLIDIQKELRINL